MFYLRPVKDERVDGGHHWVAVCEVCGEEFGDIDKFEPYNKTVQPIVWRSNAGSYLGWLYEHWRDRDKPHGCQWKARYRGDG